MNVESGFLSKHTASSAAEQIGGLSDLRPLSTSQSGFFRILVGKHLGRKVVVKTLKEECAGNQVAIIQLKKEFSVVFPLASPNVAQAYSLITLADDVPAIEMEWCGGPNVRELIGSGIKGEDAAEIIGGVLGGLMDIHQAGIVHRDIKPENVMYDPYRRVVKVIDFGCAYLTGATALQGPNGTSGYTPEEKMEPGSESEPKDDLYALGVMTAEMAEAMTAASKKDDRLRRNLKRFSAVLLEGKFQTAAEAAEGWERICKGKGRHIIPVAAGFAIILIAILFLVFRHTPEPRPAQETSFIATEPDTAASIEIIPVEVTAAEKNPADAAPSCRPPVAAASRQRPDASPDEPAAAAGDEDAYRLAINAGPLLRQANAYGASDLIKMDAFVVNFCDSVYRAEEMTFKYPRYIEEDDMRALAKRLASEYASRLDHKFKERFGTAGDPHRRRALLEGRFYGTLSTYHHNPYYK